MPTLADPTDYGNRPGDGPLRPGGQSPAETTRSDRDLPSTLSKAAQRQMAALQLCRDVKAGQEQIHAQSTAYLPKEPGEDMEAYRARLYRSVFFNVFRKTVEGLTGFVFRKDPVLGDDVPAAIRVHWENIDNEGTHGDVFARELLDDSLTAGHAAILVEFPRTDGTQTARDEQFDPFPVRPYWVPIRKDDILSWRTESINGRRILAQVVVREVSTEPDGEFGEVERTRYRVFYRRDGVVGWQLLEVTKDRAVVEVDSGTYPTQDEIPIVEVKTSGRLGLFESQPPLLDLAYLNIAHYQQWSDYANSIHKTNVPIFVTIGLTGTDDPDGNAGELVLGANTALMIPNPGGDAKYVAHDGAALQSSKQALDDLKADMATLGIQMLASQKRAAETAEAKRIDKSAEDSALGVTARGLQDALERALYFHARYLPGQPDGGSIEINRDFDAMTMDADIMQAYAVLARDLGLPIRVVLEQLRKGGRIPETADLDELEMQMLGHQVAAAMVASNAAPEPPEPEPAMREAA